MILLFMMLIFRLNLHKSPLHYAVAREFTVYLQFKYPQKTIK